MLSRVTETAIFLPDVHLQASEEPSDAWKVAKTFLLIAQPTYIILGGDFLEMECVSHWLKNKRKLLEGKRYKEDIDLANRELDDLEKRCPNSEIIFMEGNHDNWLEKYVESHPEVEGILDLKQDLKLEERGIRWVPVNEVLTIGKMNYVHGWYWNQYHARKHLLRMGDNVMYGHVHHHQVETLRLRSSNKIYSAISCGCLCNLNPAWKRNRPNDWSHGFGFVEYREDGTFQPHHIVIVDGAMSFGGNTFSVEG